MDHALNNYHSRVYHFTIGIVLSAPSILIPNAGNAESYQYTGLSIVSLCSHHLLLCTWNLAWYLDEINWDEVLNNGKESED